MSTFNLGRILPKFVGEWENGRTYQPLDIVLFGGSSWVAKQTTSNIPPTNNIVESDYWLLVAAGAMLSGNLTQEQINGIIAQLQTRGVVIDTGYVPTNDGVLTVTINNQTAATFSANQAGNTNLRMTIPTHVAQLEDSQYYITINDTLIFEETDVDIQELKPNTVIKCLELVNTLSIGNYGYITVNDVSTWIYPESYIFLTTGVSNVQINFPVGTKFCGDIDQLIDGTTLNHSTDFMLRFKGAVCEINKLN